jgi:hypothetical protein
MRSRVLARGSRGFLLAATTAMYRAVLYVKIRSIQRAGPSNGARTRASKRFAALAVVSAMALAFDGSARAADADAALDAHTLVVGTRAEPKTLNPLAITASEGHQIAGLVFLKLLQENKTIS